MSKLLLISVLFFSGCMVIKECPKCPECKPCVLDNSIIKECVDDCVWYKNQVKNFTEL